MSSDSEKPAEHEEVVSTPASADQVGSESGFNAGMVALGGFVLIGTYLVFGLLLNDYWVGWLALLLAVVAVMLPRLDREFIEQVAPTETLVKVVGYLLAVVGVFVVVEDLRFADGTLNEFPDVIGALASYVGYALAFVGARSIKT